MTRIKAIGIDGCKGGWLIALLSFSFSERPAKPAEARLPEFRLLPRIKNIRELTGAEQPVFIDMPFGLQEKGERSCDLLARQLLGERRSTIFITPCRKAVYAPNYERACLLNEKCSGKKISIQAWNLTPKIKELDLFLRQNPDWQMVFFESHPELCFAYLNNGVVLSSSKKNMAGQQQRLQLLQKYLKIEMDDLQNWQDKLGKSNINIDDLLDAIVLALCAALPAKWRKFIPEKIIVDSFGLRMNIVWF